MLLDDVITVTDDIVQVMRWAFDYLKIVARDSTPTLGCLPQCRSALPGQGARRKVPTCTDQSPAATPSRPARTPAEPDVTLQYPTRSWYIAELARSES